MSEVFYLLRDVPPTIAAAWGGWLIVGLLLLLWHLRAREWERNALLLKAAQARVRPPSGVRARASKPVAVDAFSELEAMLEPAGDTGNISRRPGD